ncbi:MAG: hypothetical protein VX768_11410 [Planctomycetota bacterium]|nr:hypothetical protein [Planctomycetota bacterium]
MTGCRFLHRLFQPFAGTSKKTVPAGVPALLPYPARQRPSERKPVTRQAGADSSNGPFCWIAIFLALAVFVPPNPVLAQQLKRVSGNAQIKGAWKEGDITLITTGRLAGAIDSLKWRGTEFIDSADHGSQL